MSNRVWEVQQYDRNQRGEGFHRIEQLSIAYPLQQKGQIMLEKLVCQPVQYLEGFLIDPFMRESGIFRREV